MKYIINKIVVFNSDELTLFLYENNQVVTRLTKPASRLLLELIQNNKKNIARDDLLERIWTTYGFTASNAGLNNYISELRKAFALFGLVNEIIVTIPKLGFRFEGDIDLMENTITTPAEPVIVDELTPPHSADIGDELPSEKKRSKASVLFSRWNFLLVVTAGTIIVILAGTDLINGESSESHSYHKISKIDKCEIFTVSKVVNTTDMKLKIEGILKREEVDCLHNSADIFYMEDRFNKETVRADLVSICSKNKDNHYDTCFNIKSQRNNFE
ncbi:winged helix-turn-helix domain-containing protein [Serratia quinivorans]|jgi:DNA-binding winged helix-turn-helix (wHTH) protein|uniref:winged helix-turn-helix domain-containing protein n=1 Tax=Serratia quinivorans TaxID=137545 RepID=UPI001C48453F|nr:winged helix-turn-helix domain-containing protein [Serratia quinivorans]MBV6690714.1 winged helix-turn-helix domain-containing protein [Serratia quinivorans]